MHNTLMDGIAFHTPVIRGVIRISYDNLHCCISLKRV